MKTALNIWTATNQKWLGESWVKTPSPRPIWSKSTLFQTKITQATQATLSWSTPQSETTDGNSFPCSLLRLSIFDDTRNCCLWCSWSRVCSAFQSILTGQFFIISDESKATTVSKMLIASPIYLYQIHNTSVT